MKKEMKKEMRLIDANALKALFDERYDDAFMQSHTRPNIAYWEAYSIGVNWGRNTIAEAPTVDAVEVVRCKDCKHLNVLNRKDLYAHCPKTNTVFLPFELDTRTHYCSLGERKDNG